MDLRENLQRTFGTAYTIERELGGGGMSRVFVAHENALNRSVVVKVLPEDMGGQLSSERFKREIAIAARLQQAHLVPLLSAGEVDGIPFFVMPFVEGETLRARIAREGEFPLTDAVRILREVASALAYSHSHGVVHRDIKPDNVLLSGGAAMVTDFGVAKAISESRTLGGSSVTEVGVALGTPAYMAPEQVSADPHVDFRADVYSWGVMAYELLTGQPPFVGRNVQALLAAHVTETPEHVARRRASIPPALAQLVMRCLEKRPADRPQSADELVHQLDVIGPTLGTTGIAHAIPRATGMRRVAVLAVIVAIVAVGILAYRSWKTPAADARIQSIAVVPLAMNAADSADYFADGIVETLIAALAKVPGLEVRPSSASLALRGRHLSDADIGRMLHVSTLLHVSVRRAPPNMRIIVDLSRVDDAKVLWADQQERPLNEVFAVQDSIATQTAHALTIHLGASDRARVRSFGTDNLQAYDFYLKALYAKQRFDEPSLRQGLALIDSALARDPRYAQAYATMAEIWVNLSDDWVAPSEGYAKAEAAARRALEIDSTLGTARGFLAIAGVTLHRDFVGALREATRAMHDDSLQASSIYPLAGVLSFAGRSDSSLRIGAHAISRDPTNSLYHLVTAWALFDAMRIDSSIVEYRKAIAIEPELPPAWNGLAESLLDSGHPEQALEALTHGEAQHSAHQAAMIRTLVALGRQAEARKLLAALVEDARHHYVSGDYIAAGYIALGDTDQTMRWLERANEQRSQWILVARSDPRWKPLRGDPRFKKLVSEIGPG